MARKQKMSANHRLIDADEIGSSEDPSQAKKLKRLCTRAQIPSSNNPVAAFEIPKAARRRDPSQKPDASASSRDAAAAMKERCRRIRSAKDDFLVSKGRVTKAVFMALLHSSCNPEGDPRFREVLCLSSKQPFADGTVFVIHDISMVCRALMQSYAFFHRRPEEIWEQESAILDFLDRNIAAASAVSSSSTCAMQGRECQPWLTLKASISRAGVCPLALAVKNARRKRRTGGDDEHASSGNDDEDDDHDQGEEDASGGGRSGEWYCVREWFMSSFIVRKSLLTGEREKYVEEPMVMASYRDWGKKVAASAASAAAVNESSRSNNDLAMQISLTSRLANDALIACGHTDPLGMWDNGSAEVSQAAGLVDALGKVQSADAVANLRTSLIARSRQKIVKYCSTPFDAVVAEPVQRVLDALVVGSSSSSSSSSAPSVIGSA